MAEGVVADCDLSVESQSEILTPDIGKQTFSLIVLRSFITILLIELLF